VLNKIKVDDMKILEAYKYLDYAIACVV